ncbi:MAG: hypothetical protein PWP54_1482 [Thermosipho sp. (in: thermotogales)]|nr:hypothetical protein [Thermosipho sp. (in: thermotogales)]
MNRNNMYIDWYLLVNKIVITSKIKKHGFGVNPKPC